MTSWFFKNKSVKNEPILSFLVYRIPKKPHQMIINVSTSPVKCSHCTLWKADSFCQSVNASKLKADILNITYVESWLERVLLMLWLHDLGLQWTIFLTVKSLLHLTHVIVLSTCFGTGFDQMKVICFWQGTVATFYRWGGSDGDVSLGFCIPKITKIGSFSPSYLKKVSALFWNMVQTAKANESNNS